MNWHIITWALSASFLRRKVVGVSLLGVGPRVALLGVGPVPSRPSFLRSLFGGTASLLLSLSAAAATKWSDNQTRRQRSHKQGKKGAVKTAASRGFIGPIGQVGFSQVPVRYEASILQVVRYEVL